jgi:hypothetical protein
MLAHRASQVGKRGGVLGGVGATVAGSAILAIVFLVFGKLDFVSNLVYLSGIALLVGLIVALPALRLNSSQVLSPRNIMLLSVSFKIILTPILISLFGYSQTVFPNLPSTSYTLSAQGIYIFAMFSCLLGFAWGFRQPKNENRWMTPNWLMWLLIGVSFAAAGLYPFLNFQQLNSTGAVASSNAIVGLVILLLRGLAPLGVLYLLFRRQKYQKRQSFSIGQMLIGLLFIVAVSLSLNRANIVYPVLAFFTVYSLYNHRMKYWQVAFGGLLSLTGVFWIGQARERFILGDTIYEQRRHLSRMNNVVDNAQVYFNGPQFGGYALRELGNKRGTALASVSESFPILGEGSRKRSGSYWFNFSIYRNEGVRDQVYPAQIEIYNNYGWVGVMLIYLLIGRCISYLHYNFLSARRNSFLAYITAYLTLMLCAFINLSLSVVGQFAFYNSLPLIVFWFWMNLTSARRKW